MARLGLLEYVEAKLKQGEEQEYKFEVGRLLTYVNWPSAVLSASPTRLAKAGFYYMGRGEEVCCYSCHVLIKDWKIGENPFQKHSALSPHCLHMLGLDENNVPITAPTDDITTSSTQQVVRAATDALGSRRPLSSLTQSTTQPRPQPRSTGLDEPDNATAAVNNITPLSRQSPRPVSLQSHLNHQGSSHADSMRDELTRLATFQSFPTTCPVRPADLARAGFFYVNVDDTVKCAFCDGMIRNWERGDRAFDEHARHFPNCSFVQQNRRNVHVESNNRPHFNQKVYCIIKFHVDITALTQHVIKIANGTNKFRRDIAGITMINTQYE
ncbi:inhibitor of apoptosis protein isoform X2 [Lingula anatina]|uniref:Inhibitor of apoptosis protein isoform X2 n=1 Tax=Lingula anatina TaxID=7574 RepID=A0A1S3K6A2_LINAN|nr:inhibitor of apoptosis protein isoform X2 [Lingula anatina]XP_013418156.1 inhibitor of apoptosis protein isoform X2 [Lingula anatina]|eukprot:XP_013418155.1 inhibitor of apoptosis protein isoform X2 [Lingula anatina]